MNLFKRLDKAEEMIKKPTFRENKGLGNEIGYYIFDYPAEKELEVRERIEYIKRKNEYSHDEYKVVVFDLYDITINILDEKGYLEKCYEFEKKRGFERITKAVGNMLRITSADSLIIQHIKENTPEKAVIFITGIGKCYPICNNQIPPYKTSSPTKKEAFIASFSLYYGFNNTDFWLLLSDREHDQLSVYRHR